MPVAAYNVSGEYAHGQGGRGRRLRGRARRSCSRRSPPSAAPAPTSSSPTTQRTPPDGSAASEGAQPQGRLRRPARRARQAAAQPAAGQLPARAAPVRARGRARRGERGRGAEPHAAAARRAHHPRDHADLRHARARLQLDARGREGGRREPLARGQDHQLAPGRVAQLPARPRLQPLVHDRDRARTRRSGSTARSTCSSGSPARESVRQLPTLRLFKIRMDLEMEKGTETLAAAAEAVEHSRARGDRAVRPRRRR